MLTKPKIAMPISIHKKSSGSFFENLSDNQPPAKAPTPNPNINIETISVTDSIFTPNKVKRSRCQTT